MSATAFQRRRREAAAALAASKQPKKRRAGPAGDPPPLRDLTVRELTAYAAELGVELPKRATKTQIVSIIQATRAA